MNVEEQRGSQSNHSIEKPNYVQNPMGTQNNPSRNHHFVPRHYLRAFAIPETERIWEYKAGRAFEPNARSSDRSPWSRHIEKSCMVRDFYAYETGAGTTDFDTFENALKKTEDWLLPFLNRLREVKTAGDYKEFLRDCKADFTEYIMLMRQRGMERREMVLNALEEHKNDDGIACISQGEKDKCMHKTMFDIEPITYNIIFNSTWFYLYPPLGENFITSDSPVGVRLNPNGFISFPISPLCALVIFRTDIHPDRRTQDTMERATAATWQDINRMTASGAKHIYHHKCEEWVADLW